MKYVAGRTKYDCMFCSLAMCFDKTYEEIESWFPNFFTPDASSPFNIAGADTDEIVRVIFEKLGLGYVCVSGTVPLNEFFPLGRCIVMKILPGGNAHMAACEHGVVYDPAFGPGILLNEWAPTHIYRFSKLS